ncbi:unnamed protein product [Callosobruchus maculatus]|uniref:Uncharacterized protein n=1 Tax=Callosobruchus maculatus TaxID=64391 RepID=A0A653BPL5_CALMS|nr:unnamed protein product [Callosobruchus maculatus]
MVRVYEIITIQEYQHERGSMSYRRRLGVYSGLLQNTGEPPPLQCRFQEFGRPQEVWKAKNVRRYKNSVPIAGPISCSLLSDRCCYLRCLGCI